MAFTKQQRAEWRRRPEVKARQHQHERNTANKRKRLGLRPHEPITIALRKQWAERQAIRRIEGAKRLAEFQARVKADAEAYHASAKGKRTEHERRRRRKECGRQARKALRAQALAKFKSKCETCGCTVVECLQFHHRIPVKRTRKTRRVNTAEHTYKQIINGVMTRKQIKLLCINCHIIEHLVEPSLIGSGVRMPNAGGV